MEDCLIGAFLPIEQQVLDALSTIPEDIEFDTLIGCGMSGALVVPMLAFGLNVPHYAVVRKPGDYHKHGTSRIEGTAGTKGWVFVDDGMSSGKTFHHTFANMEREFSCPLKGAYLYGHPLFTHSKTFISNPHAWLASPRMPI